MRSVARHRRVGSWDAGGGVSFADAAPTPATPAPTPQRRRSTTAAAPRLAPAHEPRRLTWELVRFNEVMVAVSYDGSPVSFHDVRLLLDARVYRGIEGRWRDLYARLKKHMIWSVLKSITGLQGRKLADWHGSSQRARDALARSAEEQEAAAGGAAPGPPRPAPVAHRAGVPLPPRKRSIFKRGACSRYGYRGPHARADLPCCVAASQSLGASADAASRPARAPRRRHTERCGE